ncbi:MAG: gliding motility-associated C-terminal domain-containing protein [Chitinophagaceae bacterium]
MASSAYAQPVRQPAGRSVTKDSVSFTRTLQQPLAPEICDNNLDDDNNGLADLKDFACYYSSINTDCQVSRIVWAATSQGLIWADVETGIERRVGNMNNVVMADLAWSSAGKLYGVGLSDGDIWEIDPYTSNTQFVSSIPGYYAANAMTADGSGNLYFAAFSTLTHHVIRLNIVTQQVTVVANLYQAGVTSAGDLTFLGGFLYLSCQGSQMAKINVATGNVQVIPSTFNTSNGFGMITMGDGFLYLSNGNKLYKMDPATMDAELTPYYTYTTPASSILGLSNYTEQCNAPGCKAALKINVLSPQPFCSSTGVALKGEGKGITGAAEYKWTFPDGTTQISDTLTAKIKGVYKLRYHSVPDTCGADDTIYLDIKKPALANLGNDTIICEGSQVRLSQKDTSGIASYLWQDGSTQYYFDATQPGIYSVRITNACGTSVDEVNVFAATKPKVDLGKDSAICPGTSIKLYNLDGRKTGESYNWSNGLKTDTIAVNAKGIYWLDASSACGITRDSIIISLKDSCVCAPFYASIDLGADKLICSYETALLKNNLHNPAFRYTWQNGSAANNFTAKQAGIYWVDASTYCGTVRDSIVVALKTNGCERRVSVPSAFSPNNDRNNEVFKPVVTGVPLQYEFVVYNRWGQIVFRTNDPGRGWDGSIRGAKQDSNVFVWTCAYQFSQEERKFDKGTVVLIR